ncbi:hypothetical protein MKW94_025185 [Papaver nudicaule]|uniref:Uncharacterized protein n=1 Tax=Papaver nudicaule TaxID=74823 RepID=A0AA41V559_PAPNU|nr:hypothetical protein [Papaver nudicaule]
MIMKIKIAGFIFLYLVIISCFIRISAGCGDPINSSNSTGGGGGGRRGRGFIKISTPTNSSNRTVGNNNSTGNGTNSTGNSNNCTIKSSNSTSSDTGSIMINQRKGTGAIFSFVSLIAIALIQY